VAALPLQHHRHVTWVDIDIKQAAAELAALFKEFPVHPIIVQEITKKSLRPRVEYFDNYIFVIAKMLRPTNDKRMFSVEQIAFVIADGMLLSFQQGKQGDVFDGIRAALATNEGVMRQRTADQLFYELINLMVDGYYEIVEAIDDKIEPLEIDMIDAPKPDTVRRIHQLKRELAYVRKSVWPLRELIGNLERGFSPIIKPDTIVYLRDVYDHTIQVIDTMETQRDILSGMIDIYVSSVNNQLNRVIKVLTIITTIFMPLTLVAGIFGMNFKYLPWLDSPAGPVLALAMMGVIAGLMVGFLMRKRWL
jgi:magnesium transporter